LPRANVGVAIAVPEPFATTLASWRERVGDPEGRRVPPHVTLLPPTLIRIDRLPAAERHLVDVAADGEPFELHLSGTGTFRPVSDVVFVVVAAGIAQCEQLDCAYDGLSGFEARFPVDGFTMFQQGSDGVWLPRREFPLGTG
jgi:2'-5' RNA ligase